MDEENKSTNPLSERIKQLKKGSDQVQEVITIFNEYFGEEFVDAQMTYCDDIEEHLLHYKTINDFFRTWCNAYPKEAESDLVSIEYDGVTCNTDKTKLDEIKDKDMSEFPEELLPIIDKWWQDETSQRCTSIIIRFPSVVVTNENNKSTSIQELYALVRVTSFGRLHERFQLIRSYYPLDQWNSDYCHSHISHISSDWESPCTGSGPINGTMNTLYNTFNPEIWGLFCYELDKFVRVESLAGVPYRRLESIGLSSESAVIDPKFHAPIKLNNNIIKEDLLKDYIKTLINEVDFKVAFIDNGYELGEPFEKFWIKASKVFAEWYNKKYEEGKVKSNLKALLSKDIVHKYIVREGKVYNIITYNRRRLDDMQDKLLFTFKGKEVRMHIEKKSTDTSNNEVYLLSLKFVSSLIQKILMIINYNYGRQEETTTEAQPKGRTEYI